MLTDATAFSSFSVDDLDAAETFYRDTLGLGVVRTPMGLWLRLGRRTDDGPSATDVFVYPKGDAHAPASFTVLSFGVADLPAAVAALRARGLEPERYPGMPADDDGIVHGDGQGPDITWVTDPAGNVLAVLQD